MNGKFPAPHTHMPSVDVRDVAKAHVNALSAPEAANKRFMLVEKSYFFNEFGLALDEKFGKKGDKSFPVSTGEVPYFLVMMGSCCSTQMSIFK